MKLLDGKVAVVTGAGRGLGRCHALALAAEGARVLVNDPGVTREGARTADRPADHVVEEIRAAGGEAAANYDSVDTTRGAEGIVQAALDAFGRIDILVNNAGILRDRTLVKMSDEEWDAVLAVHLRGTWACSRAAARWMKEQGSGRIINTTSVAGLKGNFGQSNYSAAKAGIYGLTMTAALELFKHGITVNALAPLARTRMTEDLDMVPPEMKPEYVSPVVVFLASDLAKDVNGRVFGIHGTHLFEYRLEVTEGVRKKTAWTPSEIAKRLDEISVSAASRTAERPAASFDAFFEALPSVFRAGKAKGWTATLHFSVPGAGDWEVRVGDGKAGVERGKPERPTCVITVDADTLQGMIEGRIDPQAAFIRGKLKATRVDELGRFGKAFDLKKLQGAPTAGGTRSGNPLDSFFQALPRGFRSDRAKGWNAVIHFAVPGAGDWTVEVADGVARVSKGKPLSPTCVITVDRDTLMGIIEGKTDPQAAFLRGRLKASRLDDLGRFGKAFDFRKVAASAVQPGAPVPKTVADPVALIRALPSKFIPERAAGFNGVLQFEVNGAEAAVEIREGTCSVKVGPHPSPTCVVRTDPESLAGVLDGSLDPAERVKVTHPPSWLKFRRCFRFEPDRGLNRALIGRRYYAPARLIRAQALAEYDKATLSRGSRIFPVTLVKDLFLQLIDDPLFNGDLSRMVHAGQEMDFHAPWKAGDVVSPRGRVIGIEDKSTGQILSFEQRLYREGEVMVRLVSHLFFRSEGSGHKAKKSEPERPAPTSTEEVAVPDDLPLRYANASGDNNPIHVDPEFARGVGFKGVILQGLCTLALAARSLPNDMKRLCVRFSNPVYPGDVLTTRFWRCGTLIEFETLNHEGARVLSEGRCEIS